MMLECSTGGLLVRAAYIHYGNKWRNVLEQNVVLKGLIVLLRHTQETGDPRSCQLASLSKFDTLNNEKALHPGDTNS